MNFLLKKISDHHADVANPEEVALASALATGFLQGAMSAADKTKLDNISSENIQGPNSSVDGAVALWNGIDGMLLKNGPILGTIATHATTDFIAAGAAMLLAGDQTIAGNKTFTDSIIANAFTGDGSALTNLDASSLTSGIVPTAQLGSGSASSSTFLRGDNTWAVPSGGGGGLVSGSITTPDSLADNIISPTATTQKALVLQEYPSQSADIFQIQDSSGRVCFRISNANNNSGMYFNNDFSINDGFAAKVTTLSGNGKNNKFGIPSTVDINADTMFATSDASRKAVVVQAQPTQSATLFEIQSSNGTPLISMDGAGGINAVVLVGDGKAVSNLDFSKVSHDSGANDMGEIGLIANSVETYSIVSHGVDAANFTVTGDAVTSTGSIITTGDISGATITASAGFVGDGSGLTGVPSSTYLAQGTATLVSGVVVVSPGFNPLGCTASYYQTGTTPAFFSPIGTLAVYIPFDGTVVITSYNADGSVNTGDNNPISWIASGLAT